MNINSNISQEQLETIERYITNTMISEELNAFKTQLENNPDFKIQVNDTITLLKGIEAQSLKEQLNEFHKDIPKQELIKKTPKIHYLKFRKLVAAAAIIIALGSFWHFRPTSSERLYSKYFYPDPGLPTTMSNTSNFEFYDAMVNYKQGDYKIAIKKWKALPSKNDTINYFLGVAYLADKNEAKSIPLLEQSIQNKEFPLVSDAHYYLGLVYLKQGNIEKAKKNLKISNLKKSKTLLSEIKN
ncbi:tetratricopeptide repeat protein [Psychroserpens ponticola]|uniref:Tetratricopeptide repeat protein n=1 Tax=Psychroserpens ponticola TaxID=2932268 RepID=A0ABY7RWP4_9FLAO|nr:tetratricopeptide repeat protein [Psychroserpens ponticola]WCO01540.1 tetratricopeptide repeat protein [Psychroserpens ponticola]